MKIDLRLMNMQIYDLYREKPRLLAENLLPLFKTANAVVAKAFETLFDLFHRTLTLKMGLAIELIGVADDLFF